MNEAITAMVQVVKKTRNPTRATWEKPLELLCIFGVIHTSFLRSASFSRNSYTTRKGDGGERLMYMFGEENMQLSFYLHLAQYVKAIYVN